MLGVDGGETAATGPLDDDPGSWGYGSVSSTPPAPKGKATLRAAALAASTHFHNTGDGGEDAVYDTAARLLAWIESDD